MQVLIRALGSRTIVLDVGHSPSNFTVGDVKQHIQTVEGITSAGDLKLEFCGKCLYDDNISLGDVGVSHGSTLHLFLPLPGGKGGFGSNLRAAGKLKQVDNFDACRDLQGRRIRHKTASEKLANWTIEAQERELEKVAMKYIKDASKGKERERHNDVDIEKVRKEVEENLNGVTQAVQAAIAVRPAALRTNGKRKRGALDTLLLGGDDNSSEDGNSSEDEEKDVGPEMQGKDVQDGAEERVHQTDAENSRRGENTGRVSNVDEKGVSEEGLTEGKTNEK